MGWIKFPVGFVHNWDILRIMGYDRHKQHNSMWLSLKTNDSTNPFWMTRNCDLTSKIGDITSRIVLWVVSFAGTATWIGHEWRCQCSLSPRWCPIYDKDKALVREMIYLFSWATEIPYWTHAHGSLNSIELCQRDSTLNGLLRTVFWQDEVRRWQGKRLMFCSNIWTLFFT
jgi:hypothetical protein